MLEGFAKVLEVLANKVSRKAAIIALGMILIYMIAVAPNVANVLLFTFCIVGMAVFFTTLQWILDFIQGRKVNSSKPEKEKEAT